MKQSDLREGATYRGKSGPDRRIDSIWAARLPDHPYPMGTRLIRWTASPDHRGQCRLVSFARWALEEVRDAGS